MKNKFKEAVGDISVNVQRLKTSLKLLAYQIEKKQVVETLAYMSNLFTWLDNIHKRLLEYTNFFEILDDKFGTNATKSIESLKKNLTEAEKCAEQIKVFVSQKKFKSAEEFLGELHIIYGNLVKYSEEIVVLPNLIDYSKLSGKDWGKIGISGIHYKSKIFLSYYFRDIDPNRDENEIFIAQYVKPTLDLLDIIPITARDYLKAHELVDDKIIELVEDCDGIIGFYTKDDSVENVEHELAHNQNVVAICRESGAKTPSMRLSRLQINFKRDETGNFIIQLVKALKEKRMFTTATDYKTYSSSFS